MKEGVVAENAGVVFTKRILAQGHNLTRQLTEHISAVLHVEDHVVGRIPEKAVLIIIDRVLGFLLKSQGFPCVQANENMRL